MKILLWDLETALSTAAIFTLKQDGYISHQNLITEGGITCAAWKWLGEKDVHGVSVLDGPGRIHDDRHVVKTLHKVLSQADVIVAHNGDSFDTKVFAARAIVHGLPRLPPIVSIDTLKVARKHFKFISNRLDYLGKHLGVGQKLETKSGLWLEVLKGNKRAVRDMLNYNKQDVLLLERVFEKLRPYIKTPITNRGNCTNCGSTKLHRRGVFKMATTGIAYPKWNCRDCGKWFRGKTKVSGDTYERAL